MDFAKTWNNLLFFGFVALERICLEKFFKPVREIYKNDVNSEVISTGLFTRVCMDVDVGKPLKMEIEYMRFASSLLVF